MPEPPEETSFSEKQKPTKTPPGVWVIVGLTCVFALIALGIGAVIVFKEFSKRNAALAAAAPTANASLSAGPAKERISPASTPPSGSEIGTKEAKPASQAPASPALADSEQDATRQQVLKRIDLMQGVTQKEKDELYVQVQRARAFTKIAVISFATGRTTPTLDDMEKLIQALRGSDSQKFLDDPTVALVMVGYADKKGDEAKNLEISRTRADSVVKALKEKWNPSNVMHAVGMGGQDMFDKDNLEKNRIVEVWAVQP